MNNDCLIISIKLKEHMIWFAFLLVILLTLFFVIGVFIPVVSTGDISSVWPASDRRIGVKFVLFFGSIVWMILLPSNYRIFSIGEFSFYPNRFEVNPYIIGRKKVFMFDEITVNQHGNYRVTVHSKNLPSWNNPIERIKAIYLKGTGFTLKETGWVDPSKIPAVLELLKNSTDYQEKGIS